jgi:hypothetical protein
MAIEGLSSATGTITAPAVAKLLPVAEKTDALLVGALAITQAGNTNAGTSSSSSTSAAAKTASNAGNASATKSDASSQPSSTTKLSAEALAQIAQLAAIDAKVRAHEAAHLAASGGLATSGASYTYQRGPNGVNYAVGGEVSIDVSPGRTPQETIQRARTIQNAALAPADPSGPDRAVAAQAQQMELQAEAELVLQQSQDSLAGKSTQDNLHKAYGADSAKQSAVNVYA